MVSKYKVTIDKAVYGGKGLGRLPDGRAVFVPFVLPGEEALIELTDQKKRFANGVCADLLSASPMRISPPCPYFSDCGGCHYQNLAYADQLRLKKQILEEQISRIASVTVEVSNVFPSSKEFGYRNSIQLHLSDEGIMGFQRAETNELVPVDECLLSRVPLKEVLPIFDFDSLTGVERMQLRWGMDDDLMITLEGDPMELPELELDVPVSIVHHSDAGSIVLAGDSYSVIAVKDVPFIVSSDAFFQANSEIAGKMVDYLSEKLSFTSNSVLLDVYCGVGLFSRFFAEKVERLIGLEVSSSAVQDFVANLDAFDHVEIYEGAAELVLPQLDLKANIVIVDPPRSGLAGNALDAIVDLHPDLIAYVSCDPSTLARDLKRFIAKGYEVDDLAMFDQFPQTYHIESICLLKRCL